MTYGGSLARPEATGYGIVYFCQEMLKTKGTSFQGKTVAVSGFGNVTWGTVQKVNEMEAKLLTFLAQMDMYMILMVLAVKKLNICLKCAHRVESSFRLCSINSA